MKQRVPVGKQLILILLVLSFQPTVVLGQYTYDEGVVGGERDASGNIVPNDAFPDMKAMTDYLL